MQEVYALYFSVFKQEKPLFKVHSSEVNKAKSKWKALLARLSHNPPHIRNSGHDERNPIRENVIVLQLSTCH